MRGISARLAQVLERRRGAAGQRLCLRLLRACHILFAVLAVGTGIRGAQAADVSRGRIQVAGEARSYLMVHPVGMVGPLPVVIALHGAAQSAQSFRDYFGLDAAAAAHGFVAVYPQGEGRVWNDSRPAAMRLKVMLRPGDDVAFLLALVHRLVAEGVADPGRIYLTGISNGGFMVERMACEQAQLFAAFSVIMATTPANAREECHPARPVPILFIHGTADGVITYNGFWTPVGATLSAPDSAALFARLNGCAAFRNRDLPDLDPADGTAVTERTWDGCQDGATVRLLSIERGGHQSPARVETKPDLATPFLGLRNHDIDAGEEVWAFMSAFSLPGAAGSGPQGGSADPAARGPAAVPLPVPSPLRSKSRGQKSTLDLSGSAGAQRGINTQ